MYDIGYNRESAADYAARWAFGRNPLYHNFDELGGDCTNFISQCIFAGCKVMNVTKDVGWYYYSLNSRAAAWSGVEYLHSFLVNNGGEGPYGEEKPIEQLSAGDVIQLGGADGFYHSCLVIKPGRIPLIAAHTNDAYNIRLDMYSYEKARGIHILGARKY